jgi:D-psicose/D-tagatose/L-ribulose 3-epimerase
MHTPALGANLWIWDSPVTIEVIRQYAPRLAAWGFDFIELPLEHPDAWDPHEARLILQAAGLQAGVCAVMSPGRDLTSTDHVVVGDTQAYVRSCVEAAAIVDARVVAGPIYAPTGRTGPISGDERSRCIDAIETSLRDVLDAAEQADVVIAVEPLNRFETSLFNTVDQAMALVEQVDRPSLGLLLDTFHMNIEERDLGAAIHRAGRHLKHFHACGNDRGAPGGDGINWMEVREALEGVGYRGALSIESFTSANRSIATAASIWRPLAPSQDHIATDGLAFLKALFSGDRRL